MLKKLKPLPKFPTLSAAFELGINDKFLGLEGFLLLSNINQLSPESVLLIIKKAGSNPVSTIGPSVEPLPMYVPNFE